MNVRRAISGNIAKTIFIENKGTEVVGIDSERLLSRLLFFDDVVINSVRLGEVPFLVRMFGRDGFEELLNSGVLRLTTETSMIVTDRKWNGVRQLPLLEFEQAFATIQDTHNLEKNLENLRKITGLSNPKREELGDLLKERLVRLSSTYGNELLSQVRKDLTTNFPLLKTLLIHKRPELDITALQLTVHDLGNGRQRFETNLQSQLHISVDEEHALLAEVISGVANLNQRVAQMAEFQAISQFEDAEAPLLFGKVHSVLRSINPQQDEEAFLRVIELTDIPKLISNRRIDVEKFVSIRDTAECREFRAWLSTTDHMDEAELRKLLTGVRAKAASFIQSGAGKAIRFAVNTGLGLIPGGGAFVAAGEGFVDTFLLDKLLPSSGILSFLTKTVPSVFQSA